MLQLDQLSKSFGDRRILDSFSLSLDKGEKILVQGPSGCGKSTLLKMILGFDLPDTGRILLDGEELTASSVWRLRRNIAYVPQEPELEDGVGEDLLKRPFTFAANAGKRESLKRVPELLAAFGLRDAVLKQSGEELSGGEKQRLMMISAIILDRPLILMDEPSSALDPEACRKAIQVFKGYTSVTMLAVSHDNEWADLADRVVTLGENT